MDASTNALNWFEIPASDFERGKTFYETIFGLELGVMEMGPMKAAAFPYEPGSGKLSGAVTTSPMHTPSSTGALLYLNANPDLQTVLDKVEEAGGKVEMPKTQISPEIGFMAFFTDSEGNKVGLHSQA